MDIDANEVINQLTAEIAQLMRDRAIDRVTITKYKNIIVDLESRNAILEREKQEAQLDADQTGSDS